MMAWQGSHRMAIPYMAGLAGRVNPTASHACAIPHRQVPSYAAAIARKGAGNVGR